MNREITAEWWIKPYDVPMELFDPPFSRNAFTNFAKKFLKLLDKHFPLSNWLGKTFNRNTMKVSYCCTQNLGNIIKSHNKKLINFNNQIILQCNCRKKGECPLEGNCRANDIVYKCISSVTGFPNKVYLGTTQEEFKKRFYNHKTSFMSKWKRNDTTPAKYLWDLKLKHNVTPTLKWHSLKSVTPYSNITKTCRLCLQEKLKIISYSNPDELLNKISKVPPPE